MGLNIFEGIDALKRHMDFHLDRHGVLSTNLANVATPGYQAKDLIFADELAGAAQAGGGAGSRAVGGESSAASGPAQTHAAHLSGDGTRLSASSNSPHDVMVVDTQFGSDDNTVRLERAMAEVRANRLRYESLTEVTRRSIAMLRYAATDGAGS